MSRLADRRDPASSVLPCALIGVLVGAMAVFAVDADGALGDLAFLLTYVTAAALAWVGVARQPPDRRAPWACVAAAATITMVGDLLYEAVLGAPPGATVADVLWLGAYGALGVGLLRLAPVRIGREAEVDAVIDSLVAVVVGGVVAWEVALGGLVVEDGASTLDRVVSGTYPLLDVVLLAVVVRLLLRGDRSRAVLQVCAGTVVLLVADLAFATDAGGAADTGLTLAWMTALLLLSSSTLPSPRLSDGAPNERLRMWLVITPVAVPIGFLLWGQVDHDHPNTGLMAASTVALLALAAVRAQRLLRTVEQAHDAVAAREHRFRALAANASETVCVTDAHGVVVWGDDGLARLLGAAPGRLAGASAADEDLLVDPPAVQRLLGRVVDAPGVLFDQEIEVRAPDASTRWWEVRVVNLLDDPVVRGIVANVRDVTERRRSEDELRDRAFHDPVTGLANRALLRDRLEQAMRRGARRGTDPALLHLRLDGLRALVDQHGHDAGDHLLRQVTDRLRNTARSEDTVARVGEHELAVLLEENHAATDEAGTTAERITQVLSTPLELDGHDVPVAVAIGVAVGDPDTSAHDLLRRAAVALDRAGGAEGPPVVAYRPEMGAQAAEQAELARTLPGAADRGELDLELVPLVRLVDDAPAGRAAVLRWRHPTLGEVPSARFLPHVDDDEVAAEIGRWALEQAGTCAAALAAEEGAAPALVAVELPVRHLLADRAAADVRHTLAATGLDPRSLVLLLDETALAADAARAEDRLPAVTATGVRIGVTAFGTGHSSLAHLRRLPVALVEVDPGFVEAIDTAPAGALPRIVQGLLDLAAPLGLDVLARRPAVRQPATSGPA